MADRPFLFSGPMVRAILEGRKTQTRRVLKIRSHKSFSEFGPSDTPGYDWHFRDAEKRWHDLRDSELRARLEYAPGDRLYVREGYSFDHSWSGVPPRDVIACTPVHYWADGNPQHGDWTRPKPGMHMPRWASRLILIVTAVRVQRLQDISEDDAVAEGVEPLHSGFFPYGITTFITTFANGREVPAQCCRTASHSFQMLWDSLNVKRGYGWEANPWVCAVTFTAHQRNIDQMEAA